MTVVLAHLGTEVPLYILGHLGTDHWWASLLYLMPVLIVVAGIGITSWRDKHRDEDGEDDDAATRPGPSAAP